MRRILLFLLFITATLSSNITYADIEYELVSFSGDAVPGRASNGFLYLEGLNQPTFTINARNVSNIFQIVFDLLIGISIATSVIVFMVAAFARIINSKNIRDVQAGRQGMENAIIGLIIVLSSWLILNTINPDLLKPESVLLYGIEHMIDTNTPTAKTPPGSFDGF